MMAWHLVSIEKISDDLPVCSSLSWIEAALYDDERPIVLQHETCSFAASIVKRPFIRVLEGCGAERRSSAGFIDFDTGNDLPEIKVEELPEHVDLIDLRRVPKAQKDIFFPNCRSRHISSDGAHYVLTLQGTWDGYLKQLKRKFRQNVQAARNRLGRDFQPEEVEFKNISVEEDNWSQIVEWWKLIDNKSWQGKDKLTALHHPEKMAFLKRIVRGNVDARVFLLFIQNKPVAIRWFFAHGPYGLFYSIQFDPAFNRYRPGHLLTAETLAYCFDKGIVRLDFGHGDSGHKKDWLATRVPLVRLLISCSWKGSVAILYQKIRWIVGDLLRKVFSLI